jgi:hypothetical protein
MAAGEENSDRDEYYIGGTSVGELSADIPSAQARL